MISKKKLKNPSLEFYCDKWADKTYHVAIHCLTFDELTKVETVIRSIRKNRMRNETRTR